MRTVGKSPTVYVQISQDVYLYAFPDNFAILKP